MTRIFKKYTEKQIKVEERITSQSDFSEESQTQKTPPNADQPPSKRMWVAWLLFFFQFLAVGAYFIYLNVYYRQAGLSGTQIGIITMSSSIIGVVSAIAWGYLSDRTGKPRLLIAGGAIGSGDCGAVLSAGAHFLGFLRSFVPGKHHGFGAGNAGRWGDAGDAGIEE